MGIWPCSVKVNTANMCSWPWHKMCGGLHCCIQFIFQCCQLWPGVKPINLWPSPQDVLARMEIEIASKKHKNRIDIKQWFFYLRNTTAYSSEVMIHFPFKSRNQSMQHRQVLSSRGSQQWINTIEVHVPWRELTYFPPGEMENHLQKLPLVEIWILVPRRVSFGIRRFLPILCKPLRP